MFVPFSEKVTCKNQDGEDLLLQKSVFATRAKRKTKIIAFQLRSPVSAFLHALSDHQTTPGTKRGKVQRYFKTLGRKSL